MDLIIEVFAFLIVGLLFWIRSSIMDELRQLRMEVFLLKDKIGKQQFTAKPQAPEKTAEESTPEPEPEISLPPIPKQDMKDGSFIAESPVFNFNPEPLEEEKEEAAPAFFMPDEEQAEPSPSFFERHPDLEKFIGENIINKIGIGILVLGIAFFVKYAIDQNWINAYGRVSIGVLCGGLLIGIAHRLHKNFKAFSSVLIGGGLAVLYFTISIAFHEYHIFSQTVAFVIMVVITAFAVMLAMIYDRMELAILAILGGFSTPFILSTGEGNYKVLFTYLFVLNCGMLVLAFRKKWNPVTLICYVFTVLIYGGWLFNSCLDMPGAPYMGAMIAGTVFYLIFFLMNIVYNVRNRMPFRVFEISMLLSNTFLYYGAGMAILHYSHHDQWQGMFTASLGVFNFVFAYALLKRQDTDRNLVFLLIGLVLTFISLAAPVQLKGNHITLFWSAEAVLLLWLSQRSGIRLIKTASFLVLGLMIVSLLLDWLEIYKSHSSSIMPVGINKGFMTGIVSILSLFLYRKLLDKEEKDFIISGEFNLALFKKILLWAFVIVLYASMLLELNYQLNMRMPFYEGRLIVLGMFNFAFLISLRMAYRETQTQLSALLFAFGFFACLLMFMLIYNGAIISARDHFFLSPEVYASYFYMHLILVALAAYSIYLFHKNAAEALTEGRDLLQWVSVFFIIYLASTELDHVVTWIAHSPEKTVAHILHQNHKAGYSILWGIISFILIQQGMKRKNRMLRIIALSLFLLTILKLFFRDIRGISEGGKIIAFISLGVLLLVVSFMYQRLKKLLLDDEREKMKAGHEN